MTPQEEKDLLLRVVSELAQRQLQGRGAVAFAATLGPNRSAKVILPTDWEPDASWDELEEYWVRELRQVVAQNETRAVCYCAHGRVPAAAGELAPRVLIHLEHVESGAEDFFYPYRREEASKIVLAEPTRHTARRRIFASAQEVS